MRQLYIALSLLCLLCSVSATNEGKNAEGKALELCSSLYCFADRGYFTNSDFLVINTVSLQSLKILISIIPTTFVVVIKGLRKESSSSSNLVICSGSCEEIPAGEDHVRIYRDVNSIALSIGDDQTSVNVEYYAGCEISSEQNLRLMRNWAEKDGPSCWITIPQLNENFHSLDVATAFTTIDNVELFGSSSLTVKNLLTGKTVEQFRSNTSKDLFEIVPVEPVSFTTDGSNSISLMLLFDVDTCGNNVKCQVYSFNSHFAVMTLQDTRCLDRARYCQFGIGKISDDGVSCEDSTTSNCSSTIDLLGKFLPTDDQSAYALDTSAKKTNKSRKRFNMRTCVEKYKKHERFFFCFKRGGKRKCKTLGLGNCYSYCKLHQEVLGTCFKRRDSMMS